MPDLREEIRVLEERLADTQMLAHQWMRCYDMLAAGVDRETMNFPRPADLPDAIRVAVEAERKRCAEAVCVYCRDLAKYPREGNKHIAQDGYFIEMCRAAAMLPESASPSPKGPGETR